MSKLRISKSGDMRSVKTHEDLLAEMDELRQQLQEAEDAIEAIRSGQVDALVVRNETGHQLYSLKSADQTYRVFIERMKEGAITLDKNGIILYSNSQFASMMDIPLSSVIGLSFIDFISPECKEYAQSLIKKGWESESRGEVPLIKKNKEIIPFLLSIGSLELDEGKALSIILTDLTNQKETEKLLKKRNEELEAAKQKTALINERLEEIVNERTKDLFISREYFKFLADNIPVIVWTASPEGKLDYFNKKWSDYTGMNLKDSTGNGWEKAIHPEDRESCITAWESSKEKQVPFECEYRLKNMAEETYRWYYIYAIPFRDEKGKLVTWLGTSTDIEDRKKEMDKKDEFIGMASHELKTPLTSLKGYIQLMDDTKQNLSGDSVLYLKKANDSVVKLQHLIDDLLDVSKIHSGKLEFTRSRSDLGKLLQEALENCAYLYPTFTFKTEIQQNLFINGNPDRLEQVMMNLINNAVHYSANSREIIVTARREQEQVRVAVKDFGIGLSAEDKRLIFDRFYRAQTSKHMPGGLGMGLYIAAEIVKAHGGTLEVESELKQGSVFSFLLPAL